MGLETEAISANCLIPVFGFNKSLNFVIFTTQVWDAVFDGVDL
jgi:hypothetical protein